MFQDRNPGLDSQAQEIDKSYVSMMLSEIQQTMPYLYSENKKDQASAISAIETYLSEIMNEYFKGIPTNTMDAFLKKMGAKEGDDTSDLLSLFPQESKRFSELLNEFSKQGPQEFHAILQTIMQLAVLKDLTEYNKVKQEHFEKINTDKKTKATADDESTRLARETMLAAIPAKIKSIKATILGQEQLQEEVVSEDRKANPADTSEEQEEEVHSTYDSLLQDIQVIAEGLYTEEYRAQASSEIDIYLSEIIQPFIEGVDKKTMDAFYKKMRETFGNSDISDFTDILPLLPQESKQFADLLNEFSSQGPKEFLPILKMITQFAEIKNHTAKETIPEKIKNLRSDIAEQIKSPLAQAVIDIKNKEAALAVKAAATVVQDKKKGIESYAVTLESKKEDTLNRKRRGLLSLLSNPSFANKSTEQKIAAVKRLISHPDLNAHHRSIGGLLKSRKGEKTTAVKLLTEYLTALEQLDNIEKVQPKAAAVAPVSDSTAQVSGITTGQSIPPAPDTQVGNEDIKIKAERDPSPLGNEGAQEPAPVTAEPARSVPPVVESGQLENSDLKDPEPEPVAAEPARSVPPVVEPAQLANPELKDPEPAPLEAEPAPLEAEPARSVPPVVESEQLEIPSFGDEKNPGDSIQAQVGSTISTPEAKPQKSQFEHAITEFLQDTQPKFHKNMRIFVEAMDKIAGSLSPDEQHQLNEYLKPFRDILNNPFADAKNIDDIAAIVNRGNITFEILLRNLQRCVAQNALFDDFLKKMMKEHPTLAQEFRKASGGQQLPMLDFVAMPMQNTTRYELAIKGMLDKHKELPEPVIPDTHPIYQSLAYSKNNSAKIQLAQGEIFTLGQIEDYMRDLEKRGGQINKYRLGALQSVIDKINKAAPKKDIIAQIDLLLKDGTLRRHHATPKGMKKSYEGQDTTTTKLLKNYRAALQASVNFKPIKEASPEKPAVPVKAKRGPKPEDAKDAAQSPPSPAQQHQIGLEARKQEALQLLDEIKQNEQGNHLFALEKMETSMRQAIDLAVSIRGVSMIMSYMNKTPDERQAFEKRIDAAREFIPEEQKQQFDDAYNNYNVIELEGFIKHAEEMKQQEELNDDETLVQDIEAIMASGTQDNPHDDDNDDDLNLNIAEMLGEIDTQIAANAAGRAELEQLLSSTDQLTNTDEARDIDDNDFDTTLSSTGQVTNTADTASIVSSDTKERDDQVEETKFDGRKNLEDLSKDQPTVEKMQKLVDFMKGMPSFTEIARAVKAENLDEDVIKKYAKAGRSKRDTIDAWRKRSSKGNGDQHPAAEQAHLFAQLFYKNAKGEISPEDFKKNLEEILGNLKAIKADGKPLTQMHHLRLSTPEQTAPEQISTSTVKRQ